MPEGVAGPEHGDDGVRHDCSGVQHYYGDAGHSSDHAGCDSSGVEGMIQSEYGTEKGMLCHFS